MRVIHANGYLCAAEDAAVTVSRLSYIRIIVTAFVIAIKCFLKLALRA